MKLNVVKGNTRANSTEVGFTLIEMIGVLAVIAILAALLIPKVFNAINSARINNAAVSIDSMRTAVTDHYGKYGLLATQGGTIPLPTGSTNFDQILISEGLLDKPFAVNIGTSSSVQLIQGGGFLTTGYALDGTNVSTKNQAYVAEVVINGVLVQDAIDLNTLIDGANLGTTNIALQDAQGRLEYVAPSNGVVTVYVYLTGR